PLLPPAVTLVFTPTPLLPPAVTFAVTPAPPVPPTVALAVTLVPPLPPTAVFAVTWTPATLTFTCAPISGKPSARAVVGESPTRRSARPAEGTSIRRHLPIPTPILSLGLRSTRLRVTCYTNLDIRL